MTKYRFNLAVVNTSFVFVKGTVTSWILSNDLQIREKMHIRSYKKVQPRVNLKAPDVVHFDLNGMAAQWDISYYTFRHTLLLSINVRNWNRFTWLRMWTIYSSGDTRGH